MLFVMLNSSLQHFLSYFPKRINVSCFFIFSRWDILTHRPFPPKVFTSNILCSLGPFQTFKDNLISSNVSAFSSSEMVQVMLCALNQFLVLSFCLTCTFFFLKYYCVWMGCLCTCQFFIPPPSLGRTFCDWDVCLGVGWGNWGICPRSYFQTSLTLCMVVASVKMSDRLLLAALRRGFEWDWDHHTASKIHAPVSPILNCFRQLTVHLSVTISISLSSTNWTLPAMRRLFNLAYTYLRFLTTTKYLVLPESLQVNDLCLILPPGFLLSLCFYLIFHFW